MNDRSGWVRFALCALASLVPLWSVRYLPMTDLPQHAAQISMWLHLEDPKFGFASRVEMNPFTPYWLGYALTRGLAAFFPILTSLKVTISLSVIGFAAAMRWLLRETSLHPDWALLGFPMAFGFSFQWGFVNYLLALPLGLLFLAGAHRYTQMPTVGRAVGLAGFGCLLFFAHVLVLGMVGLAAALLIAARAPTLRQAVARASPLLVPFAVAVAWVWRTQARDAQVHAPTVWAFSIFRPLEPFALLLGNTYDLVAFGGGIVLVSILFWGGLRLTAHRADWLPAAAALAITLLAPHRAFGNSFVQERFAVFIVPFLLFGMKPGPPRLEQRARPLILTFTLVWLGFVLYRHQGFDKEARELDPLIAQMPPNQRVLALNYERISRYVEGVPFLHHAVWYQVEKGGVMGFSFAELYPELFRYRAGAMPPMTPALEWYPQRFRWETDGAWYDEYLIRAINEPGPIVFAGAPDPVVLEGHSGLFWRYRHVRRSKP